jgi:HlyD family secretion protein
MRKAQPTWERLSRAAVRRVSFDACHTASGVVQCPQQTVVKCQLENLRIRSRGGGFFVGGASTILDVVPNGTTVKKGDVLCTLDASEYEEVALAQTIGSATAEEVQRDTGLQSAELALKEYRDGLFAQDIMGMQGRIVLAEAEMSAASDRLAWSERMAAKGYASMRQVANDREALLSSTLRLRQAEMELDNYRRKRAEDHLRAQGRCRESPRDVHSRGGRLSEEQSPARSLPRFSKTLYHPRPSRRFRHLRQRAVP